MEGVLGILYCTDYTYIIEAPKGIVAQPLFELLPSPSAETRFLKIGLGLTGLKGMRLGRVFGGFRAPAFRGAKKKGGVMGL